MALSSGMIQPGWSWLSQNLWKQCHNSFITNLSRSVGFTPNSLEIDRALNVYKIENLASARHVFWHSLSCSQMWGALMWLLGQEKSSSSSGTCLQAFFSRQFAGRVKNKFHHTVILNLIKDLFRRNTVLLAKLVFSKIALWNLWVGCDISSHPPNQILL